MAARTSTIAWLTGLCLAVSAIWGAHPAWADVYKCRTPEGKALFQSSPCEGQNVPERQVAANPATPQAMAQQQERENALALTAARQAFDRGDYQSAANTCNMRQSALGVVNGGSGDDFASLCTEARKLALQRNLADQQAEREAKVRRDAAAAASAEAAARQNACEDDDCDRWNGGWPGYGWNGYRLPQAPGGHRPPSGGPADSPFISQRPFPPQPQAGQGNRPRPPKQPRNEEHRGRR
jgi:hypothetical protein